MATMDVDAANHWITKYKNNTPVINWRVIFCRNIFKLFKSYDKINFYKDLRIDFIKYSKN